jgi:hypothetical protein
VTGVPCRFLDHVQHDEPEVRHLVRMRPHLLPFGLCFGHRAVGGQPFSSGGGRSGAAQPPSACPPRRNDFANQTQLLAVAKNARVIGTQTIDGVATTEYAGSVHAAEALKAMPASLRKAMAPELQVLGNGTISFHVWIDGQHHTRKIADVETVNGETINTTVNITAINQPVQITLPPASQTVTPPGA